MSWKSNVLDFEKHSLKSFDICNMTNFVLRIQNIWYAQSKFLETCDWNIINPPKTVLSITQFFLQGVIRFILDVSADASIKQWEEHFLLLSWKATYCVEQWLWLSILSYLQ